MIYILYGSQSGNCENISKILYDILNTKGEPIIYGTLNSILNQIDNINGTMYIICSTFGNGDAPENASAFWRTIKNRKIKNDIFTAVRNSNAYF